ncbi:MAG: hypothetical protein A3I01_03925 [Betaproteobacteria bacterium RIFCSPLOWO2_02_FULL_65_24]|nr:MAG: hypothetical protein A3I01_03925 [Betaproteobacteria bacterium RIFCSPLOWO2_02_FULL_65_24]
MTRLGVYSGLILQHRTEFDYGVLGAAVISAFLGAILGKRYLPKVTMGAIQGIVAAMLFVVALGLISGVL